MFMLLGYGDRKMSVGEEIILIKNILKGILKESKIQRKFNKIWHVRDKPKCDKLTVDVLLVTDKKCYLTAKALSQINGVCCGTIDQLSKDKLDLYIIKFSLQYNFLRTILTHAECIVVLFRICHEIVALSRIC